MKGLDPLEYQALSDFHRHQNEANFTVYACQPTIDRLLARRLIAGKIRPDQSGMDDVVVTAIGRLALIAYEAIDKPIKV